MKKTKDRGITLIALVITIIILLILAGITINVLTGQNGMLTNVKEAKKRHEIAQHKEEIEIKYLELEAIKVDQINYQEWITEMQSKGIIENYTGETHWVYSEVASVNIPNMEKGEYPVVTAKNTSYSYYLKSYGEAVYIEGNNGKNEGNGSEETDNIEVMFSETEWLEDEIAKVTVSTNNTDTSNIFEYKITNMDDIETEWVEVEGNSQEIQGLEEGNKIVGRVISIDEEGETTVKAINSITIMEENIEIPDMQIIVEDTDSDYIAISVEINNEEVMPDEIEYTYYIKKSSENNYREMETTDSEIYEFDNLEPNTQYDIKVVTVNAAGEKGEIIKTIKTDSEPKSVVEGSKEILRGAVYFRKLKWNPDEGKLSLQVYTNKKGYKIQYQINTQDEGNWTTVESGTYIDTLKHGDIIYARVTDETNYGRKTYKKNIKDKNKPSIKIGVINRSEGAFGVQVINAKDTKSGIERPIQYTYELRKWRGNTIVSTTQLGTTTEVTKTVTGLSTGYYSIRVKVTDRAGNQKIRGTGIYHIKGEARTLSYNANGGIGAPESKIAYEGQNVTLSTTKPTKSGYNFKGWSLDGTADNTVYKAGSKYKIETTDVVLYAVWEPREYTISVADIATTGFTVSLSIKDVDRANIQTIKYYVNDSTSGTYYQTSNVINNLSDYTKKYVWTEVVFNDGDILRSNNYKIVYTAHSHNSGCYNLTSDIYYSCVYNKEVEESYKTAKDYLRCSSCGSKGSSKTIGYCGNYIIGDIDYESRPCHTNKSSCYALNSLYVEGNWTTSESTVYPKHCKECEGNIYDSDSSATAVNKCKHSTKVLSCTKNTSGSQSNYNF